MILLAFLLCEEPAGAPLPQFFAEGEWPMNGFFSVAVMTSVLHYTMGDIEIDAESCTLSTTQQPIPVLFATDAGAGGVQGANRLTRSSLLGCVVFGRAPTAPAPAPAKDVTTRRRIRSRPERVHDGRNSQA